MPAPLLCPSVTPPASDDAGELEFWLERAAREGQPILTLAARAMPDAPLDYAGAALAPTTLAQLQNGASGETLRLAGACAEHRCVFFTEGGCELAASVARHLPTSGAPRVPVCSIRARCRWWHQHGAAACARCPDVSNQTRATPLARQIFEEALENARAKPEQ